MSQSIADQARRALKELGEGSVFDIARHIGQDSRPVGQALGSEAKRPHGSVERVTRGYYRWVDNKDAKAETVETPEDLRPLLDTIGVEAFEACDLLLVARTQDGGYLCTDRNGVAWKVDLVASARLI